MHLSNLLLLYSIVVINLQIIPRRKEYNVRIRVVSFSILLIEL